MIRVYVGAEDWNPDIEVSVGSQTVVWVEGDLQSYRHAFVAEIRQGRNQVTVAGTDAAHVADTLRAMADEIEAGEIWA